MSFEKDQIKIFKKSLRNVKLEDLRLLEAYKGSLKSVRSDLLKFAEKLEEITFSQATRFNRLRKLEQLIRDEIRRLGLEIDKIINAFAVNQYNESYYQYWFAIEKEIQFTVRLGLLKADDIKAAIQFPWSGETLKFKLKQKTINLIRMVNKDIVRGLIEGEGIDKIARRIRDNYNKDFNNAKTIARTETLRAHSQSSLWAHDESVKKGIDLLKRWLATQGARTRPSHARAHRQVADKDGNFHLTNPSIKLQAPRLTGVAAHAINCRCDYVDEVVGLDERLEKRKKELGLKDLNFDDWIKDKL